jgi:acylphosphatase
LEDVNGELTSLSEVNGFRNYVAARMRQMGLKGYIKRVPRQHAKLVVSGTHAQIQDVEDFLGELEEIGMIHGHFREKPEMIPVSKTFKVLSSDRKYVLTGSYSNPRLDDAPSHFSADEPILREPSTDKAY